MDINLTPAKSQLKRLDCLDGLRGVLCLIVVFHHFRCGFDPCLVFGESAEWVTEPTECERNRPTKFLEPFANGTFAVAVFFVMSGVVLSRSFLLGTNNNHNDSRLRIAVVKRYFRLCLPCAAALVFAYALGGFKVHEMAAKVTLSRWLIYFPMRRPSPVFGLLSQILWGVWHGTCTLNNAIWTMKVELFGSFLVFGLVAVLKDCQPRTRQRLLAALFLFLLVPSVSIQSTVAVEFTWQSKSSFGEDSTGTAMKTIKSTVNPMKHFHVLALLWKKQDAKILELGLREKKLKPWWAGKDKNEPFVLDSPKNLTNSEIYLNLLDTSSSQHILPQQTLVKSTGWSSANPNIFYAAFVAGVLITDWNIHQLKTSLTNSKALALTIAAATCASYPLGSLLVETSPIWALMKIIAGYCSLAALSSLLYYILGGACLVQLALNWDPARHFFESQWLLWFGKISFSLYLTHIPILYTLTCSLFLWLHNRGWSVYAASRLAFIGSLPFMIACALFFFHVVDKPFISLSTRIAKKLLGLGP